MPGRAPSEVTVRRLASVGTLIASLEMLSQSSRFEKGDLLGSELERLHPEFADRFPRLARALSSKQATVIAYGTQAALSAATLVKPRNRALRVVGGATLAALGAAQRLRNPLGGDGADQLQQIVNLTLAITGLIEDEDKSRDIAMRTLAIETTISYTASGLVKLVSPVWLKGEAVSGVMRTRNYGDPRVFRLLHKHPGLAKAVSWGTVAAETAFPVVFLLPRPLARAYLGSMVAFHVGIGQFMGLNRFVWAFGATHPAIWYVISQRRQPALSPAR